MSKYENLHFANGSKFVVMLAFSCCLALHTDLNRLHKVPQDAQF